MIIPIILSGGSGQRLWPLSRQNCPKQFLSLHDEESIFIQTIKRLPENVEKPLIICNEEHRFIVAEELRKSNVKVNGIILEPIGRDTAPAIAAAVFHCLKNFENPNFLVLSSDHVMEPNENFYNALNLANEICQENIVTFGIKPDSPKTNFGYIETVSSKNDYLDVISFREKPDLSLANTFVKKPNFFWNSGIFLFSAKIFLAELKKFEPDIFFNTEIAVDNSTVDNDFIRLEKKTFESINKISFDYAILENTSKIKVIPLNLKWIDIGSWNNYFEIKPKDPNGNVVEGDVVLKSVKNTLIHSQKVLTAVIGVSDIRVINTPDALLVTHKDFDQEVKQLISQIETREEYLNQYFSERPWGSYQVLFKDQNVQIKQIIVKNGRKLSLQKHSHRSEHWVVISGEGYVTRGNEYFPLRANESTFIPIGEVHRLENKADNDLIIIEIQTGNYLGEDDIIRYEDDYNRV